MNDKTENKQEKAPEHFAEKVWNTLAKIDVADHCAKLEATKKRPAITYLPWHKAWMLTKRKFPASEFQYEDDLIHHGGSVEVGVRVMIRERVDGEYVLAYARLAVMDFHFNAILDPNAREKNDARQRCLVKALAFAGLGLNLWSESPMPVGRLSDPISHKQVKTLEDLIEKSETDMEFFLEWCECELDELPKERYASAYNLLVAKLNKLEKERTKK